MPLPRTDESRCFLWGSFLAAVLAGMGAGCVGPVAGNPPLLREPPRDVVAETMVHDRLEVADTLEFRFSDGTSAALHERVEVLADGTVEITGCGRIQVAGKTLEEARDLVREHVAAARSLAAPVVELSFAQFYVVTESSEGQRHIERHPVDGKPKVCDALAGVSDVGQKVVWVVRPSAGNSIGQQMLAVDWDAITRGQDETTNYELQAGDWVFALNEPARGFGRFMGAFTSMVRENRTASAPAEASTAEH